MNTLMSPPKGKVTCKAISKASQHHCAPALPFLLLMSKLNCTPSSVRKGKCNSVSLPWVSSHSGITHQIRLQGRNRTLTIELFCHLLLTQKNKFWFKSYIWIYKQWINILMNILINFLRSLGSKESYSILLVTFIVEKRLNKELSSYPRWLTRVYRMWYQPS